MSSTTPALDRATEAVSQPIPDVNRLSHHEIQQWLARAALSAALTDPDDPDFGARNLYETEHAAWLRSEDAPNWQWEILPEAERNVYRARYTNLVAAILGGSA